AGGRQDHLGDRSRRLVNDRSRALNARSSAGPEKLRPGGGPSHLRTRSRRIAIRQVIRLQSFVLTSAVVRRRCVPCLPVAGSELNSEEDSVCAPSSPWPRRLDWWSRRWRSRTGLSPTVPDQKGKARSRPKRTPPNNSTNFLHRSRSTPT